MQPSPLRIAYLGKILDHYETLYQEKMPSDFWQIHLYRLNEAPCNDGWGAGIPPESLSAFGWQVDFTAADVLNVEAIMNSVRDFRQWMRDEGYREQPLIISEFGVLPPLSTEFSNQVAADFLTEIFNRLLTETDADIGYPADENRLVQAWAWYSTDDSGGNSLDYGGDLFNSNGQLTVIGQAFKEIAEANYTPYVDLQVIPSAEKIAVSNNIIPLTFYVENRGNITATASSVQIEVRSLDQNTIFSSQTVLVSELSPRYRQTPLLVSEDISPPQGVASVSIVVTLNHPEDVNTANDVLTIEVEIPNLDLSLDAIEIMPLGVFNSTQENTVWLKSTISNIGDVASTQTNLSIRVQEQNQVNPVILPTVVMPSLNPNMSATLTTTWQITGMGRYTIEAIVNNPAQPDFVEDRFDNNHKKITENFKPDLSLDRLTISPVQPSDGDEDGETTKYITVTVSNQGNWPAPQTTWFLTIQEMMQGQNNLITTPVFMMPEIGLNQSQSFSTALAITDIGTYRVTSTVNLPSQPSFDELDFTNNQREAMMVIKPDLEVFRIEVSPLRVLGAVEPNIVTITINNVGTWVAPTTTLTLFKQRIDQGQDKLLKSFNLAKTRIGLQHRLTITWPITEAGAYQIEARVNVDQPPEFDEHSFENNWAKGGLIAVQNDDNIAVVTPNVATNFVSQGPTTTIVIPSQAVTESIALAYTSLISPSLATPTKWHFVNRAFRLNVYQSGVLITEFDFIQPLTVTLVYSDEALATANAALEGAPLLEENMRLYQRHNDVWRLAGATCGLTTNTQVDVVANLVSTQICQSGEFTLFAVNFESLYLPYSLQISELENIINVKHEP